MVTLALAAVLSTYEFLWLLVEKEHPDLYAKYELIDEGEHRSGQVTPGHVADHILIADINGDGEHDYILVVVPKRGTGHAILALLGEGKTQKAFVLIDRAEGRAAGIALRAESRPTASQASTLVVTSHEGSSRHFRWRPSTRAFDEVAPE